MITKCSLFEDIDTLLKRYIENFIKSLDESLQNPVSNAWLKYHCDEATGESRNLVKVSDSSKPSETRKCAYIFRKGRSMGTGCSVSVTDNKFCGRHRIVPILPNEILERDMDELEKNIDDYQNTIDDEVYLTSYSENDDAAMDAIMDDKEVSDYE